MNENFRNYLLIAILVCTLLCFSTSLGHKNKNKLTDDPDFSYYHTTDQIDNEIINLSQNCDGMLSYKQLSHNPNIKLLNINSASPTTQNTEKTEKLKAFLLFGEHAREMISPEAGLSLLQVFCNQKKASSSLLQQKVKDILQNYQIQMVINANPISRQKVENGDYCLRTNENGVDINRNWDAHWEFSVQKDTYSGDEPFSEIETQLFRDALADLSPQIFLTVHSGTYGMYTPYAYSQEEGIFNEQSMLDVTEHLNSKYCNCDSGAAGKQVGYLCPGTCLDYAYDQLNTPYAFAWEIYEQDFSYLTTSSFLQKQNQSQNNKLISKMHDHHKNSKSSCFIQTSTHTNSKLSPTECFQFFNPATEQKYIETVDNWTNAMIDMFIQVQKEINKSN